MQGVEYQLDEAGYVMTPLDRSQVNAAPPEAPRRYTPEEVAGAILHGELVPYYQPKVELATGSPRP